MQLVRFVREGEAALRDGERLTEKPEQLVRREGDDLQAREDAVQIGGELVSRSR